MDLNIFAAKCFFTRLFPSLLILMLAACAPSPSTDEPGPLGATKNWPGLLGANQDGVSAETGLVGGIPQAGLPVLWKKNVGISMAGIAAVNGKVYTMGLNSGVRAGTNSYAAGVPYTDPKSPTANLTLYCLDARTGKVQWKFSYEAANRFQVMDWKSKKVKTVWEDFAGPKSVPTIDRDRVYIYDQAGLLTCLDTRNGDIQWQVSVREKLSGIPPRYGFAASPVIVGDLVVVPVFAKNYGMAAFHKKNGKVAWKGGNILSDNDIQRRWDCYSSPRVQRMADGKARLLFYTGAGVEALNAANGKLIWEFPIQHTSREVVMTPIISGDTVFVSSHYASKGVLLNAAAQPPTPIWENQNMISHYSNIGLLDGYLYGSSGYDRAIKFSCVELKTGAVKWGVPLQQGGAGPHEQGQVLIADRKLFILTSYGELIMAEANPQAYKELGRQQLLDPKGRAWCPMALSDGLLFCKDSLGNMACVNLKKEK